MGVSLIDFIGNETGKKDEYVPNGQGGVITYASEGLTSPVFNEVYTLKLSNIGGSPPLSRTGLGYTIASGEWSTVGFIIRFRNIVNGPGIFFRPNRLDFKFKVEDTTGDFEISDANNVLKADISGVFSANTYYKIEFKYLKSNSGRLVVFVDGIEVADISSDFDGTSGLQSYRFENASVQNIADLNIYITDFYWLVDDGANIDTHQTFLKNWHVQGGYQNDSNTTSAPDFGNNLDSNAWDDAGGTPRTGTPMGYNISFFITKQGGITCESGNTRKGPFGEPKSKVGEWVGGKCIYMVRESISANTTFKGMSGIQGDAFPSTDATTVVISTTNIVTGSYRSAMFVIHKNDVGGFDPEIPDPNPSTLDKQVWQLGWNASTSNLVGLTLECDGMWGMILFRLLDPNEWEGHSNKPIQISTEMIKL